MLVTGPSIVTCPAAICAVTDCVVVMPAAAVGAVSGTMAAASDVVLETGGVAFRAGPPEHALTERAKSNNKLERSTKRLTGLIP